MAMNVLWVVNMIMPDFARALKLDVNNRGGWMPALVSALRHYAPNLKLHICSAGPANAHAETEGVNYYALGDAYEGHFIHKPSRTISRNMARLICEINPDIIHFHGSEGLFGTIDADVYDRNKCVVSLQGILQGAYPHYTGGINELEIRKYRNYANFLLTRYTITHGAESWRVRLGERERVALSRVRYVMGRTEWDRAWACYLAPSARYFHVGEVLRPEFYTGFRDKREVVKHQIYCGGAMAYPLKGGHWLLRAMGYLRRKYPDIKLRVANADKIMPKAGIGDWVKRNEYRRYLWRLIEENQLEKNVALLPSLTASQVADELRKSELFCLPSMCENSPNSIGEAMLLGIPILATDVGGVSSIIKDGDEGILIPPGDPAMLAMKIEYCFEHEEKMDILTNNAYKVSSKRYDPELVVKELLEAYGQMK